MITIIVPAIAYYMNLFTLGKFQTGCGSAFYQFALNLKEFVIFVWYLNAIWFLLTWRCPKWKILKDKFPRAVIWQSVIWCLFLYMTFFYSKYFIIYRFVSGEFHEICMRFVWTSKLIVTESESVISSYFLFILCL